MLYTMTKRGVGWLARAVYRPTILGGENVPDTGPVILAANHLSVADSFIVPLVLTRPVSFLAKAEYFQRQDAKGRIARWALTSLNAIPSSAGGAGRRRSRSPPRSGCSPTTASSASIPNAAVPPTVRRTGGAPAWSAEERRVGEEGTSRV